jgi:hypothetical protein
MHFEVIVFNLNRDGNWVETNCDSVHTLCSCNQIFSLVVVLLIFWVIRNPLVLREVVSPFHGAVGNTFDIGQQKFVIFLFDFYLVKLCMFRNSERICFHTSKDSEVILLKIFPLLILTFMYEMFQSREAVCRWVIND